MNTITQEEITTANKTSRSNKCFVKRAITPKYVKQTSLVSEAILDFGAGKDAIHTKNMIKEGFHDVVAYDFGDNDTEYHNSNALSRSYDTVMASNVINIQSSKAMLHHTLHQLKDAVKENGRVVLNYPVSPRKGYMANITVKMLEDILFLYFTSIEIVGGTKQAPIFELRI